MYHYKNVKTLILGLLIACAFSATYARVSPYDAARHADLDALRQYRFESVDLFTPDARGFIPYELAALHADPDKHDSVRKHVEVMLWLKEYKPKKHRYGKASIALVQAGLNALGYSAGKADGFLGQKTINAIKSYQKNNKLAQTGRLGPQWLGDFYQDILKDMQFKLTKTGFETKGRDGIMGKNTHDAILKFRRSHQLSNPDYPYLDALLLNRINGAYLVQEKEKTQRIAKKMRLAKEKSIAFVQAGLRTLGYRIGKIDGVLGSKTTNAIKAFQSKYQLPISGDVDVATQSKMTAAFLKETQRKLNFLGYQTGKPDGKMGGKTRSALERYRLRQKLTISGFTATLIASVDDRFDIAIEKKAAARHPKNRATTQSTSTPAKSRKVPIQTASSKKSKGNSPSKSTVAIRGNSAKGRMVFSRAQGRVVGCHINRQGIPIEWCEPFYPLPQNNYCEATLKASSGEVINLWCK